MVCGVEDGGAYITAGETVEHYLLLRTGLFFGNGVCPRFRCSPQLKIYLLYAFLINVDQCAYDVEWSITPVAMVMIAAVMLTRDLRRMNNTFFLCYTHKKKTKILVEQRGKKNSSERIFRHPQKIMMTAGGSPGQLGSHRRSRG